MPPPLIFDYFPDGGHSDEFHQASSLLIDESTGSGYPDLTQDLAYSYGETDTRGIAKSEMDPNVPFMASGNSDENDLSETTYDQQRPTFTFPQSLSGENLPLDQYTSYPGFRYCPPRLTSSPPRRSGDISQDCRASPPPPTLTLPRRSSPRQLPSNRRSRSASPSLNTNPYHSRSPIPASNDNEDLSSVSGNSRRRCRRPGDAYIRNRWTDEEHNTLITLCTAGHTWEYIATRLPGRAKNQIRDRYRDHLEKLRVPTPTKWTEEEDEQLMRLREQGYDYAECALRMQGKTRMLCRNRGTALGLGPRGGRTREGRASRGGQAPRHRSQ